MFPSTPLAVQRTIRCVGIFSAVGIAFLLLSFGALAIAMSFRPDVNGVNPWIAICGIAAALFFHFAAGYVGKTLLFAPISDIAARIPKATGIVAYFISSGLLHTQVLREFSRGNVYFDLGRTVAPLLIALVVYRLLRFYIKPYFPQRKA